MYIGNKASLCTGHRKQASIDLLFQVFCMAAIKDATGFVVLRFFCGFLQSIFVGNMVRLHTQGTVATIGKETGTLRSYL